MKTGAHAPAKAPATPSPSSTAVPTGLLQRKCACGGSTGMADQCAACRKERLTLQRRATPEATPAAVPPIEYEILRHSRPQVGSAGPPPIQFGHEFSQIRIRAADFPHNKVLHSGTSADRFVSIPGSSGSPLPEPTRVLLEERFGTSLLDVRVHSDESAANTALELGARAFTHGRDIFFAPGHYRPTTPAGVALLAHEVTHVIQQRSGRYLRSGTTAHVARVRSTLEQEADRIERSVQYSTLPLEVQHHEPENEIHRSPIPPDNVRAGSTRNIQTLADGITENIGAADPIILQLNELRTQLTGMSHVIFSPEAITELEATYYRFRALAPAWLPVPDVYLMPLPVQRAAFVIAGVAISVEALLLLLAICVVVWFIITNLNPETRRQREREVQRIIDAIKQAVSKAPKRTPIPQEEPTGTTFYYDPEPEPEEEEPERCVPKIKFALGGNKEHDALAAYVTNSPLEYEVTSPSGLSYQYDGMDEANTLYEVKTRHDFLAVLGLPEQQLTNWGAVRVASGVSALRINTETEVAIAAECGYDFRIAVNDAQVAEYMRELLGDIIDPEKIELVDYPPRPQPSRR